MASVVAEKMDMPAGKRVFLFKKGHSDGNKDMKTLLGGKGANLCEMARIGLNVPPGLTITTECCEQFYKEGQNLPAGLWEEILETLSKVEEAYGAKFGDANDPLLVSVRSGAAVSMPGMMDTVLNLGLNDTILKGLIKRNGPRFAYDCYRRLLDMFADVVLGVDHKLFDTELAAVKAAKGVKLDVELDADDLKVVVDKYKEVYVKNGIVFPQEPRDQMRMAIEAVFRSWNIPRAVKYRELNCISGLKGTAVNIQSMVYGNFNERSGTGVCFTRDPANGNNELFGEYLTNAQGEDVVAGIRTPMPISQLKNQFPDVYQDFWDMTQLLERHMGDMQDIEFTVQNQRLWMLQTRNGKRTGAAALKIATDMVAEGKISRAKAIGMLEARHLDQLLHPQFDNPKAYKTAVVAHGLNASPGAAVGRIVFHASDAEEWHANGEKVLLVRNETSPEDVGGMHAAEGILTAHGGKTSHAAVVARGWGKPCVCGCDALEIDEDKRRLVIGAKSYKEGDWMSINGETGEVIEGKQAVSRPEMSGGLGKFMSWVDQCRRLEVWTNADTPEDARVARENGASGIGLVRTEHMFFSTPNRIAAVRRMIAASELKSEEVRDAALKEIEAFQKEDFEGIFLAMNGLPVTIRLLDPPLHEFLPQTGAALRNLCQELSSSLGVDPAKIEARIDSLREANPMMGFRGCRLGVVHPYITETQIAAIFKAACAAQKAGAHVHPHIMVPLVGSTPELKDQAGLVHKVAKRVQAQEGTSVDYMVGTMIEVPRGALQAGELAKTAQFFSFGTNDLTQMTYGFSRDDAEAKFLPHYVRNGILPSDPFRELDTEGVGELVRIAVERGRKTNPNLELGICGEHGGDPASIDFFHKVGLAYVSCSPLRVPIARLSAAQAALRENPDFAPPELREVKPVA